MNNQSPGVVGAQGLRWSGETHRGRVRKNNEDAFLCLQFDAQEIRYLGRVGQAPHASVDYVFAVSDGMGGAMAGEFASRITVDKITRLLPRSFNHTAQGLTAGFADILAELFHEIHRALTYLASSDPDCSGMGATLSMCWFTPGWMYFGHIGDSRIYYLPAREPGLRQLTHDDTHVGWLFRQGKISEWEAKHHPRRTALQRALGADHQFVEPQVGAVSCEEGDRFILCTDGLVDGLYDAQLLEFLKAPAPEDWNPAHVLVEASIERAGKDNTTAVVIEAV